MAEAEQIHIVVVEDDKDISRMLKTILTMDGYRVSVSPDGESGLAMVAEASPDMVILDVMMPGKSGLDVMREMRMDPASKDIPILFISAVDDESVVVQALKGADDYVLKPFKSLELSTRIAKVLSRAGVESGRKSERRPTTLPVQRGDETYLVPLGEIFFIAAKGKYSYVHSRNKRFLTGYSIGELEQKLEGSGSFIRAHRSFIVNSECIQKVRKDPKGKLTLVVSDEARTQIPVSASYMESIRERLGI